MARQDERRAATRRKILHAAAELFQNNGFEKTTIAQIVEHADIVKGTFYQHFQTKMDLLVVLGRQDGTERVQKLIAQVDQGGSALEALQSYYQALAQWFEACPNIAEDVMISAIRLHDPNAGSPEHAAHDFTRLMLKLARQRNEIRDDLDLDGMALSLGGAFLFAVIDWCRAPDGMSLQRRWQGCLQIFIEGVRPRAAQQVSGAVNG